MNNTKKRIGFVTFCLYTTLLLTGCPAKKAPPDQLFTEAYARILEDSYNFTGHITAKIVFNENAVVAEEGKLTEKQSQEEQGLIQTLATEQGQIMIATINNSRITYNGAYDNKNSMYDVNVVSNINVDDFIYNVESFFYFDLRKNIDIYFDLSVLANNDSLNPRLTYLPRLIDGKLIKLTLDEIPSLTTKFKEKLRPNSFIYKKIKQILSTYWYNVKPNSFTEVAVINEAKKAGAVQTIQLNLPAKEWQYLNLVRNANLYNEIGAEFSTSFVQSLQSQIDNYKLNFINIDDTSSFLNNMTIYTSLNKHNQVVHILYLATYSGAQHIATIQHSIFINNYDKPLLFTDPSKQSFVDLFELLPWLK